MSITAEKTEQKITYLKDYKAPTFIVEEVYFYFDLHEEATEVKTVLRLKRNLQVASSDQPLILDGEELKLIAVRLNGQTLLSTQYQVTDNQLIIAKVPDHFDLETEVIINPKANLALMGLYLAKGNYCTQCESQGFRRITYFFDRPDVMSRFTTTITADKKRYPVLLSNGNLVDQKDLSNGRHWVMWQDPSLKPCYLFALVAGDYEHIEDKFITSSKRLVKLQVYVEKDKLDQAQFAMTALQRAMKWDEETYGREYDLDIYMIVAVSTFNMGAMENKGLNIFNDKYILAKPTTATDSDYVAIESVIGHEYFHNWSGNRVTVRDWFQITLKEGFTIFRDQNFTADMTSRAVKRIQDVNVIRTAQFAQDASPMAHSIQPDHYLEINNFYTVTVYNKGAEVIRMLETLLGKKLFRQGMDLYFSRNDGKAITTEEFVKAMEDISGLDLKQFRRWYTEAGTPTLIVNGEYDAAKKTFCLTVKQDKDFYLPFAMGLLTAQHIDLPLQLKGKTAASSGTRILVIKDKIQQFEFINVAEKPIPSLLRNFSAPVKLEYPYQRDELLFLMQYDSDPFNQWDAQQRVATDLIMQLIKDYRLKQPLQSDSTFIAALETVLLNQQLDKSFICEMLTLPSEAYLIQYMTTADVEAIFNTRQFLKTAIAEALQEQLWQSYQQNTDSHYEFNAVAMGRRNLKNLCLTYLVHLQKSQWIEQCLKQFKQANNMTDSIGALVAINTIPCQEREQLLQQFYDQWQHESLVVDKWLMLHAVAPLPHALQKVKALLKHPAFDLKNPNKVRALIDMFCRQNHINFHHIDGSGYEFLVDQVLIIDKFNPHAAARSLEPLIRFKKFDAKRQQLMKAQLQRMAKEPKLSKDVYEIVSRSLNS